MYLNGQVVCLDPYSPEYVCAEGVSATQVRPRNAAHTVKFSATKN